MDLLAVHISDGNCRPNWQIGGFVVAGTLLILFGRHLADAEIPASGAVVGRVLRGVVDPFARRTDDDVHLLLNGLVGVVLGRRAILAILSAWCSQAILVGHGDLCTRREHLRHDIAGLLGCDSFHRSEAYSRSRSTLGPGVARRHLRGALGRIAAGGA